MKDKASARVCDTHGNTVLNVKAVRTGNEITVSFDTLPDGVRVLLRNIGSVKAVSGAAASPDVLGTVLTVSGKTVVIEL